MSSLDDDGPRVRTRKKSHRSHERSMAQVLDHEPGSAEVVEDEETEEQTALRYMAEVRREQAALRLARSGIPAIWHEATWADLDATENDVRAAAIEGCSRWARGAVLGLVLAGGVGVGKSRMVATAAVQRCAFGPLRWLSFAELLMKLSMSFSASERDDAIRALNPGSNVTLVIDDLDKSKPTEHALQPLYVAVNRWVEAGAPLAVTMNLGDLDELAADFGARYGDPIASRLAEHCEVFELSGRDRRIEP